VAFETQRANIRLIHSAHADEASYLHQLTVKGVALHGDQFGAGEPERPSYNRSIQANATEGRRSLTELEVTPQAGATEIQRVRSRSVSSLVTRTFGRRHKKTFLSLKVAIDVRASEVYFATALRCRDDG
jgi:hypothetical protein